MSRYYVLKKEDEQQARDQIQFLFLLQKAIPAVQVQPAMIITVPDDLNCLIQALDGKLIVDRVYELKKQAWIEERLQEARQASPIVVPTSEKSQKKARRPSPAGKCSQCGNFLPLTKTGICRPCAMRNAKAQKKNGKAIPLDQVGSVEKKINASTRTEEHFTTRRGPIKARKLG